MPTFSLADLFELVVDVAADREAVVTPARRLTFAQLDERANRFANHLLAAGIGPGAHVGLQLMNGTEYLEAMLGCFKARAVPINVNYRYVERELAYLFDDADLVALVYHRRFGPRVASAAHGLGELRHTVVVEDGVGEDVAPGSIAYEDALDAAAADRPAVGDRSSDDHYIAYTGGTTGMPKGVLWRHEDVFFAAIGGGAPMAPEHAITRPDELAARVSEIGLVALQTPPLMHVSAQWGALTTLFGGGKVVFADSGHFDADAVWRMVADERVNSLTIVGDAMGRPLADALTAATEAGEPYDVSSLFVIGSGGAMLSPTVKTRLTELLPHVIVVDGFGSSETGVLGAGMVTAGGSVDGSRFRVDTLTTVLDDDGRAVEPGSGVVGHLARRGHLPLGYYKDEAKTAAAFVDVDGVRWALPGDMATVEADGTVALLGRGSVSINTGGEKVYPEEVEAVLKGHPDVADAIVVGTPDEQWGERVVAIVQPRNGATPDLADLEAHCRAELAHYKVPGDMLVVDEVVRSPAGKPDYRWARAIARRAVGRPR
ncbi:MAG: acyl-CoA synthetase [Acidimicrobiia bacterium]